MNVAFVDMTVPSEAEGGKAIEDTGKGRAEEGQDTHGESSGGRGGGSGVGKQRMTPRPAPVAFVDLTVPRVTEGGKVIEDR